MMHTLNPESLEDGTRLLLPELLLLPEGPVRDHAVVVADGRFHAVGPARLLCDRYPHLSPVPLHGQLLMPGFVDAHHHLTQSFGTSLAFGEPSEIFRRVWLPLEGALDEESAYLAAKLACLEALRGGFTTVTDAGTRAPVDTDVLAAAARDTGIRCVLGLVCNDLSPEGKTAVDTGTVLAGAEKHLSRYTGADLVHPTLAVSIPEVATERTLRTTGRMAAEAGTVVQVHVNEHLAAVERSLVQHGMRPLEYLHAVGAVGPQLLAAHATLLTPGELGLLRDSGAAVSYNPVASAWKGNAVARAGAMAEQGIRFGLGTDGTRGDAFRLVDAAEFAQRLTHGLADGDPSCGGGWTWLDHGTRLSAEAVGLGGATGEVVEGRAADFLLLDITGPEMRPSWDTPWELVRLAGRDQITATVVAGRLCLWRGWPRSWDGPELVERAAEVGQRVVEEAPITRTHPVSTHHRPFRGRASESRGERA
ncbi:cytosine/adenosine deaminase-related metal-dependent hydrolase [Haloactinospora alba]|uniref:Cytosine/adenosine deaminase-related metal-dependent hydrolase n=1 Tax=Haloactinospora alba TaxID=405555 RepID=A0A543NNV4_9ACTN|nr:amidohydrolase family protein [Haloactinospora alba]TQN33457.1 cytosine/adenosine deaminase-related metal-dependent hydrolase [Haloactinospora alba]